VDKVGVAQTIWDMETIAPKSTRSTQDMVINSEKYIQFHIFIES